MKLITDKLQEKEFEVADLICGYVDQCDIPALLDLYKHIYGETDVWRELKRLSEEKING